MAGHAIPIAPPPNRYVTPPKDPLCFDYSTPFLCPPPEIKQQLWDAAKAEFDTLQQRMRTSTDNNESAALSARCEYLRQIMAINAD